MTTKWLDVITQVYTYWSILWKKTRGRTLWLLCIQWHITRHRLPCWVVCSSLSPGLGDHAATMRNQIRWNSIQSIGRLEQGLLGFLAKDRKVTTPDWLQTLIQATQGADLSGDFFNGPTRSIASMMKPQTGKFRQLLFQLGIGRPGNKLKVFFNMKILQAPVIAGTLGGCWEEQFWSLYPDSCLVVSSVVTYIW